MRQLLFQQHHHLCDLGLSLKKGKGWDAVGERYALGEVSGRKEDTAETTLLVTSNMLNTYHLPPCAVASTASGTVVTEDPLPPSFVAKFKECTDNTANTSETAHVNKGEGLPVPRVIYLSNASLCITCSMHYLGAATEVSRVFFCFSARGGVSSAVVLKRVPSVKPTQQTRTGSATALIRSLATAAPPPSAFVVQGCPGKGSFPSGGEGGIGYFHVA